MSGHFKKSSKPISSKPYVSSGSKRAISAEGARVVQEELEQHQAQKKSRKPVQKMSERIHYDDDYHHDDDDDDGSQAHFHGNTSAAVDEGQEYDDDDDDDTTASAINSDLNNPSQRATVNLHLLQQQQQLQHQQLQQKIRQPMTQQQFTQKQVQLLAQKNMQVMNSQFQAANQSLLADTELLSMGFNSFVQSMPKNETSLGGGVHLEVDEWKQKNKLESIQAELEEDFQAGCQMNLVDEVYFLDICALYEPFVKDSPDLAYEFLRGLYIAKYSDLIENRRRSIYSWIELVLGIYLCNAENEVPQWLNSYTRTSYKSQGTSWLTATTQKRKLPVELEEKNESEEKNEAKEEINKALDNHPFIKSEWYKNKRNLFHIGRMMELFVPVEFAPKFASIRSSLILPDGKKKDDGVKPVKGSIVTFERPFATPIEAIGYPIAKPTSVILSLPRYDSFNSFLSETHEDKPLNFDQVAYGYRQDCLNYILATHDINKQFLKQEDVKSKVLDYWNLHKLGPNEIKCEVKYFTFINNLRLTMNQKPEFNDLRVRTYSLIIVRLEDELKKEPAKSSSDYISVKEKLSAWQYSDEFKSSEDIKKIEAEIKAWRKEWKIKEVSCVV